MTKLDRLTYTWPRDMCPLGRWLYRPHLVLSGNDGTGSSWLVAVTPSPITTPLGVGAPGGVVLPERVHPSLLIVLTSSIHPARHGRPDSAAPGPRWRDRAEVAPPRVAAMLVQARRQQIAPPRVPTKTPMGRDGAENTRTLSPFTRLPLPDLRERPAVGETHLYYVEYQ
jgi:hypothetical protein